MAWRSVMPSRAIRNSISLVNDPSPPKKMRAAGNVEGQSVRRIKRHCGRVTDAAIQQSFQPILIGTAVMVRHLQIRDPRTRIRKHERSEERRVGKECGSTCRSRVARE